MIIAGFRSYAYRQTTRQTVLSSGSVITTRPVAVAAALVHPYLHMQGVGGSR